MPLAHHTHIIAVVHPLVRKRHALADLGAGHQVSQRRRKIPQRQVGTTLFQKPARVAGCERHHPHRNSRRLAFHHRNQARNQLGGGGVGHGQHEGVGGGGGFKILRHQSDLQG